MKVNINFEGLNKILCKFGKHRWARDNYPTGSDGHTYYYNPVVEFCLDCGWELRMHDLVDDTKEE